MCLYSTIILTRKYPENKKNGGIVPAVSDKRTLYVPIGCGHCMECRKQKTNSWRVRLLEDIKEHTNGKFVTLTFSTESLKKLTSYIRDGADDPFNIPEGYELDNTICTVAMRLFLERWRKKYKRSLRHWIVSELGHGATEHVHLHGIVRTEQEIASQEKVRQYGYVWKGKLKGHHKGIPVLENYVNAKTVNYITKYVCKIDLIHQKYKPVILSTDGIGRNYIEEYSHTEEKIILHINKKTKERRWYVRKIKRYRKKQVGEYKGNYYTGEDTNQSYRTSTGHKMALPTYWRNKIYNDDEKEKLWIQQLDKGERYVNGKKIDVSKSEWPYYYAVKEAQKWNRELGYGGNEKKDWNRLKYEQMRRILVQAERLKA